MRAQRLKTVDVDEGKLLKINFNLRSNSVS